MIKQTFRVLAVSLLISLPVAGLADSAKEMLQAGRVDDAISALIRASRWGTTDKPLYQGHLAIARCAKGEVVAKNCAARSSTASDRRRVSQHDHASA